MHQIGDNIGWILPPRTGTRYTLLMIRRHSENNKECCQHEVIPELLGDRLLYMNIRNPYTRLQSFWRLLHRPYLKDPDNPVHLNISFEDYILNLTKFKKFSEKGLQNSFYGSPEWKNQYLTDDINWQDGKLVHPFPIRYPFQLVRYLKDIPVERVDKFIRMESFYEDLEDAGFPPDLPKKHGHGDNCIGLEWFNDHPKCVEIINQFYKEDFETFGYTVVSPVVPNH